MRCGVARRRQGRPRLENASSACRRDRPAWRGCVFINRQLLLEPYLPKHTYTFPSSGAAGDTMRSAGWYFVLGDNRFPQLRQPQYVRCTANRSSSAPPPNDLSAPTLRLTHCRYGMNDAAREDDFAVHLPLAESYGLATPPQARWWRAAGRLRRLAQPGAQHGPDFKRHAFAGSSRRLRISRSISARAAGDRREPVGGCRSGRPPHLLRQQR